MNSISVMQAEPHSPLISEVVKLADSNTKWLGFFPREAWQKSASVGRVLVAVHTETNQLLGYLLYYLARERAVIQQLCVRDGCRGDGVGRRLVDKLKRCTRHLEGISLHCARDFPAHAFWPRVEFIAMGSKPGRGTEPRTLTRFWFDHGSPDLFRRHPDASVVAVLDANIFFDLYAAHPTSREETLGLQADWLQEEVELRITDEIFNEINRNPDPGERERLFNVARSLRKVEGDSAKVANWIEQIRSLVVDRKRASDESDVRHLARSLAANVGFFVTRDERLLRKTAPLWERFDIRILRPVELITHFDELRRDEEYAPGRLAGSGVARRRITATDIAGLASRFLSTASGEQKHVFRDRLNAGLAKPDSIEAIQLFVASEPVALFVADRNDQRTPEIHFLRCSGHRLAPTIARHLVARAIGSIQPGRYQLTVLRDEAIGDVVQGAAEELGFTKGRGAWCKLSLRLCGSVGEVLAAVQSIRENHEEHRGLFDRIQEHGERASATDAEPQTLRDLERLLFPARLVHERLPNFIVPIQPRWAKHLFDAGLASQELFAVDESLALACENVYYRSAHVPVVTSPAHVLWYVTQDSSSGQVCQLRACSAVDDVIKDVPKNLFHRFQRLGVYSWKDVLGIAKEEHNRPVLSIRFALTELFERPLKRNQIEEILKQHEKPMPPLSMPYRVSGQCFKEIYDRCIG